MPVTAATAPPTSVRWPSCPATCSKSSPAAPSATFRRRSGRSSTPKPPGLAGGTGTCAFLVGVGRITAEGFRIRQFFMRDYGEEASMLDALASHLAPFRVLITYNGRAFDQPLLETRYRLNRARSPFTRFEHLDLLHGARRLWKLRFESCRLIELEQQMLGFERQGDVPGAMIPAIYFDYVRTGEMARLLPVFHHNVLDIVTLACLTGIVPYAFKDPATAPLRHGSEMAGIARWLREAGEMEQARTLFRRAVDAGLPDDILFRTLWDIAALERKLGCEEAALGVWNDLAACRNPFRVRAMEELAKHHEHRAKDYPLALELTRRALALEVSPALRKREQRLMKRTCKIGCVVVWSRPALVCFSALEFRRQLGAFAEEVFFHLLEQEFLRFGLAQVEAVLVHDHLHVFHPALPRLFRNVFVDALAQRVAVEGNFVEAGQFLL